MVIANPIYDVVFKRMMENERVAKFFIGTLLEQTIETVEVKPQEFTYTDELAGIALFRLDFIATIRTAAGELKKVLIEIQKARNQVDLVRFRSYLAEQYKKEDLVNNEKTILPITTIYILGFTLPEIETACIKVERNYKDLINQTIIEKKNDFIEKLTHDCFVVQVNRITDRYQTRLDKLLSVFEQSNFIDDSRLIKQFTHQTDVEELKIITDILHHTGTDPVEKKKIEDEQEAWRSINALFEDERKSIEKERNEFEKERKAIENERNEFENKRNEYENKRNEFLRERNEYDKALNEKDKALAEIKKQLEDLKRRLNEQ